MTLPRRQTACGMRHCCARRIEECLGRRRLLRTSTRWAERQRIIGAEANRISRHQRGNAARRHSHSGGIKVIQPRDCQSKAFLLGFQRGHSLLRKRMAPLIRTPGRRRAPYCTSAVLSASNVNSVHARSSLTPCSSRNALYAASSMLSPFSV